MRWFILLLIPLMLSVNLYGAWGTEEMPLILIYSPISPEYGQRLGELISEDERIDAVIEVLETHEMFNIMMHYPRVKVAVVMINTNVNQDIGLALEWFFRKGGGLVGLGFAGSEPATGGASSTVFPIFANMYRSGEFDPRTRSFKMTHIRENEDEINRDVPDFTASDGKIILSLDPATKEYVPRAPPAGEYTVLYRESSTGAPSIVKFREKGASVTFACFSGDDMPTSFGYFGRFTETPEFETLFTNAVYWAWENEEKYDKSVEYAAAHVERQDEVDELRKDASEREDAASSGRLIQILITVVLSGLGIAAVYWATFRGSPE